jgi:phosphoribosylglycinamide formyltransferase-1
MADWLAERGVRLVVCAGYMHLLTPGFLERFPVLNVHPSLLPAFPGMHAIEDALAAGIPETGVTVHFVDEGVDTGPVVLQEAIAVGPDDTADTLRPRLRKLEHRLLPQAARMYVEGRLRSPNS